MAYDPATESMVNEARAITCVEWLTRNNLIGTTKGTIRKNGNNYAGPCPKCGGDDRFGVDAGQDKWICRGCGLGGNDAISMVILLWPMKHQSYGECFLEACELMTGRTRTEVISAAELKAREEAAAEKRRKQEEESERRREEARKNAHRVWRRGYDAGRGIAEYYEARGLKFDVAAISKVVREVPDLEYWHDGKVLHKGLAMVSAIQWADDRFGGVHRTWLDPRGKKGKAVILSADKTEALDVKKVMGSLGDGAIRLITPEGATRMVVGEGQETTLTPYVFEGRRDTAYWCAITLGHLAGRAGRHPDTGKRVPDEPDMQDEKCFRVPPWVQELVLLADGDSDPKATREAMTRAAKRAKRRRPGLVVKIAWPGINGDFNDLAMKEEKL